MVDAGNNSNGTAEAAVTQVMTALREQHGFEVLHGALLGRMTEKGPVTAFLDHVIVDAFGVLVVEVKSARDAVIRGRYTDRTWSARYPEGRTEIVQNPIQHNDQHVSLAYELLTAAGWGLTLDHVRGLVVFADADISGLELDSVSAARVTDLAHLAMRYEGRAQLAACPPLPAEQIGRLAAAIGQLDVSADPAFARTPTDEIAQPLPTPLEQQEVPQAETVAPARSRLDPDLVRQVATVAIALVALFLVGTLAVMGLRSLSTAPPPPDSRPQQADPVASPPGQPAVAPAVQEQPQVKIKPDVELAGRRLKETYPGHYNGVSDLDAPRIIDVVDGQITYEWEYVEKSASNAIVIGKVSITLDADGKVIGSSE